MSEPVIQQPPTEPAPTGDAAVAVAAGVVAADVAPAVAGAVAAKQIADATAEILQATKLFLRKRQKDDAVFIATLLHQQYPERTDGEVNAIVRDEVAREAEFRRRMVARMEADLPDALKEADPAVRGTRVKAILDRERRYLELRQQALSDRAIAAAERRTVKAASPEGAYWHLSPFVREHTLDCLAMGNKFWPWEVLDAYHPPLHHGCACELYTLEEARERDLVGDQLPDKADAIARAQEIIARTSKLKEALGPEATDVAIGMILEEARQPRRIPRGFEGGGRFAPKNPLLTAIRHLLPHLDAPTHARKNGRGRWSNIEGRRVFVPEGRAMRREVNGRLYTSPPQSTRVYRDGELYDKPGDRKAGGAPRGKLAGPAGELSAAVSRDVRSIREEQHRDASNQAWRAVGERRAEVPPVYEGEVGIEALDALQMVGFYEKDVRETNAKIVVTLGHDDGHRLSVIFDPETGKVKGSQWLPSQRGPRAVAEALDRPPQTTQEFLASIDAWIRRSARENGHTPLLSEVKVSGDHADHAGEHFWDGTVALGEDVDSAVEDAAAARAAGVPMTDEQRQSLYASYRVAYHEGSHAANPISQAEYETVEGQALEEMLAEEAARIHATRALREQGLDEALAWASDNPWHYDVVGTYHDFRQGFDGLLDRGRVPPELREQAILDLKDKVAPEERWGVIGDLLHRWNPEVFTDREQGAAAAADAMYSAGAYSQDAGAFTPLLMGDMPLGRPTTVSVENGTIQLGSRVMVAQRVLERASPGGGKRSYRTERKTGTVTDVSVPTTTGETMLSVEYDDGTSRSALMPHEILQVVGRDPELLVGDHQLQPGDVVSWPRSDGGHTEARVDRILRAGDNWAVEAVTLEHDGALNPGHRLILTDGRTGGQMVRERPGETISGPGTVPDSPESAPDTPPEAPRAPDTTGAGGTSPDAEPSTRADRARRRVAAQVDVWIANRWAHVEQHGGDAWDVGQLEGLGLAREVVLAGGNDHDLLRAALLRGPKRGGSDRNEGFQAGMRTAAIELQRREPQLVGGKASPARVFRASMPGGEGAVTGGNFGPMVYTTSTRYDAENFQVGARTISPLDVDLKRPLVVDMGGTGEGKLDAVFEQISAAVGEPITGAAGDRDRLPELLRAAGYDGLVVKQVGLSQFKAPFPTWTMALASEQVRVAGKASPQADGGVGDMLKALGVPVHVSVPFDIQKAVSGQWVADSHGRQFRVMEVLGNDDDGVLGITLRSASGVESTWHPADLPAMTFLGNPTAAPRPEPVLAHPYAKPGAQTTDDGTVVYEKSAGGTNGAWFGKDPEGNRWIVKAYKGNVDRVATELLANAVYDELGVPVPKAGSKLVQGKPAIAYPIVVGTPGSYQLQVQQPHSKLGEGFMADALLANWDVVGLEHDNLLWPEGASSVQADMQPVRLDQGGTFQFRAQGATKAFGPVPAEVWSMRGPKGQAYGTMQTTPLGRKAQAEHIGAVLTDKRIDALVDDAPFADELMKAEVRQALKDRVQWMRQYAQGLVQEEGGKASPVAGVGKLSPSAGDAAGKLKSMFGGWFVESEPQPLEGKDARDELVQLQDGWELTPEETAVLQQFIESPLDFGHPDDPMFLPGVETDPGAVGGAPLVALDGPPEFPGDVVLEPGPGPNRVVAEAQYWAKRGAPKAATPATLEPIDVEKLPVDKPVTVLIGDSTKRWDFGKSREGELFMREQQKGAKWTPFDGDVATVQLRRSGQPGTPKKQTESMTPKIAAGVLVEEPDGRVWSFEPSGHFGGVSRSLPKGRVDDGQTEQEAALRELWEETGLTGEITGDIGWYPGQMTLTHFFRARRTGGAPWAHDGKETAAVYLERPEAAAQRLQGRDQTVMQHAGVAASPPGALDGLIRDAKLREELTVYVPLPNDATGLEGFVGATFSDKRYFTGTTSRKLVSQGSSYMRVTVPTHSRLLYLRGVPGFEEADGPELIGPRDQRLKVVGHSTVDGKEVLDAVLLPGGKRSPLAGLPHVYEGAGGGPGTVFYEKNQELTRLYARRAVLDAQAKDDPAAVAELAQVRGQITRTLVSAMVGG